MTCSAVAAALVVGACANSAESNTAEPGKSTVEGADVQVKGISVSRPTEYVGMTRRIELDPSAPEKVLDRFFGKTDNATETIEVGPGMRVIAEPHPKTSAERVMRVEIDVDADPGTRTIAAAPYSKATSAVFVEAVLAEVARAAAVENDPKTVANKARLEYRTVSANGGSVVVSLVDDPGADPYLEIAANSPVTSLSNNKINEPASDDTPVESIYGLVWFGVTRDNFDFFVNRAYGLSAGKSQNFKDLELVPHNWLRLTVTPQLDRGRVDVSFEVVTVNGDRIALARAPASLVAGEQFMRTVIGQLDAMKQQEAESPGSSADWSTPFYYDDPDGGGVVEVIAQGVGGEFQIAYAVESPKTPLTEVDFVPYPGKVEVPSDWDAPDPTCEKLGATTSAAGKFDISFVASSTVRSAVGTTPIVGTVYGTVWNAADVKISGPIPGAQQVATFTVPNIDATNGPSTPFLVDTQLPTGNYQILGFLDLDNNADPAKPFPDEGDPVFIPIGGYPLACDRQPVDAEFALTLPPGIGRN